jgi:hypothetical protein
VEEEEEEEEEEGEEEEAESLREGSEGNYIYYKETASFVTEKHQSSFL